MLINSIWSNCLTRVNSIFADDQIALWMPKVELKSNDNRKLYLIGPNKYSLAWLKTNVAPLVEDEASKHGLAALVEVTTKLPNDAEINFDRPNNCELEPSPRGIDDNAPVANGFGQPLAESELPQLYQKYTFESFVLGKSNQLAYASAEHVAKQSKGTFNPLFIYGNTALGKTHLMCAVGNQRKRQCPSAKICLVSAEQFVADMVDAIKKKRMDDFKRYYRSANLLLIDDIQFFSHKNQTQEEFFHTFNWLLEADQQMIFTCDRYPKKIDGLEERLKSRFGSGLTVEVSPPEYETRVAILQKKAEAAGIELPFEVASYIGEKIKTNARELEGAIKRLSAASMFTSQPISLSLAKVALSQLFAVYHNNITIEQIQREVADHQNIKVAEMVARRRLAHLVYARHLAMYLAKELTTKSLPEIGESFGGRDHTTVLHGYNKLKNLLNTSEQTREDIKLLNRRLNI